MKKRFLKFKISELSSVTRYILYIGMTLAILFLLSGIIIYYEPIKFNIHLSNFELGNQLITSGYAFIICTFLAAALSEYCMVQVKKSDN